MRWDLGYRVMTLGFAVVELAVAIGSFVAGDWWSGITCLAFSLMFALLSHLRNGWIRMGYQHGRADQLLEQFGHLHGEEWQE